MSNNKHIGSSFESFLKEEAPAVLAKAIPRRRIPTHPGEVLRQEFLLPMKITQTVLAEKLDIPVRRINEIVNGKHGINAETAWLLAGAFGTTPEFWMNLQANYDLAKARPRRVIARVVAR